MSGTSGQACCILGVCCPPDSADPVWVLCLVAVALLSLAAMNAKENR